MDLSARSSLLDLQDWGQFSVSAGNTAPRSSTGVTPKNLTAENKELQIRLEEAEETLRAIRAGEVDAIIVSGVNGEQIYSLKEVEEALRVSEARFKGLFEDSPISLWEEDFSAVKGRLDALRAVGITDFQEYFISHPEVVTQCAALIKILDINKATMSMFGVDRKDDPLKNSAKIFEGEPMQVFRDELVNIAAGKISFDWEGINKTPDGRLIDVSLNWSAARGHEDSLSRVIVSMIDITKRRQAEEKLRESEQQYRRIIETAQEGVWTLDPADRTTLVNQRLADMLGYTIEEMMGRSIYDFLDDEGRAIAAKSLANRRMGISEQLDSKFTRKDGGVLWTLMETSPLLDQDHTYLGSLAMLTDITDRRLASDAVQQAKDFAEDVIQTANVIFLHLDSSGTILNFNAAAELITGYDRREVLGRKWAELMSSNESQPNGKEGSDQFVYRGKGPLNLGKTIRTKLGEQRNILWNHNVLHDAGKVSGIISFGIDITEQKRGETRIQRQLDHLTSLSAIDQVISSNFNLEISLSQILNHVTTQLEVDAADILIFDPNMEILEFAAEHGFRTQVIKKTQVRLGKGFAGRVVLERHLIQLPYLNDDSDILSHAAHLVGEGFVIYFGVPLISKGQVKGVLEVYNRTALKPDEEWFNFLDTLAGQTAIAIENATLFTGLQLSNTELTLAYDATIEGWSRALDLRDKETEGHTQRVTEKTVRLAATFGLNEKELVQVRWGALLHDIGKMGVPDGILLKPGPLTDLEWIAMKKHPTFAFEMLSPIRFLRHALDIPYCHHEKWDGTGYPRGLKGDQIPLVARIFAVVDVWDALSSDRPYRKAWPEEKILEHIRSLSGTHFEPHVVDIIMGIYNETKHLFPTDRV